MATTTKSETSFLAFSLCISGYVLLFWLAVYTNALNEWRWWHIPLAPVFFVLGLMMQIIPYEYIKERLEKYNIETADNIALGAWIATLIIYGIVIKIKAGIS